MNRAKHGIDFKQAQALWLDPKRVEFPARVGHEVRSLVVGVIEGQYWTAVITNRGDKVRLISARRSRPSEVAHYGHHG